MYWQTVCCSPEAGKKGRKSRNTPIKQLAFKKANESANATPCYGKPEKKEMRRGYLKAGSISY